MVRFVRAARRQLRRIAASTARPARVEVTDRIDLELSAREEMRAGHRATLGGAYRWWGV
jgi:hypothetical protein